MRGSNHWGVTPPARTAFHAPEDWLAGAREAAPEGAELEVVPVIVKAGGGAFHHNATWHGSEPNHSSTVARMGLVSHMLPAQARFHETNVDVNYSRYRRRGDLVDGRVVLPGDVGSRRLPHALARRSSPTST